MNYYTPVIEHYSYLAPVVIPNFIYRQEIYTAKVRAILSIHLSSSGSGKFIILKDNKTIATLFTDSYNRQCQYTIPLSVERDSKIEIEFKNRDTQSMDMYAVVQVEKERNNL